MANFKYVAINNNGEEVEGVVKSSNQNMAVIELKKLYPSVKSIQEIREKNSILDKDIGGNKLNVKNLSLICQQLSIILNAGLPLTTAIRIVGEQTEDKRLKELFLNVAEDVKGGSGVADAFEKRDKDLPSTFTEPIRASEIGGNVDETFNRLSYYFTNKSDVADKVKSALIYPAFVIVLGVIVIAVIMIVAVPMFTETFAELGTELPLPTKMLIAASNFTRNWIWLIALIIVVIIVAYIFYRRTEDGLYASDVWKLKMPILGKVRMMSAASEFSNSFSMMINSGLPVVKALRIASKALSNYAISKDVEESTKLVESGYRISDSLKKTTQLPNLLLEVIGIGEKTGSLDKSLSVIATYYDKEARDMTDKAIKVLEPSIIIVLAVFVVWILLAVYLPMFSMYGSM